ncbi:AAA family ATPase [Pseudomonadota bacterium]
MTDLYLSREQVDAVNEQLERVQNEIKKSIIGQSEVVEQLIVALLANGHVLIEGVPGLAKTLMARCLAKTVSGDFSRIQFTPDLMPSDITGHVMYDMERKTFRVRKGPVFTNILLADEINRSPAKTQAALLEVMQEQQVTLEGETYVTGKPFLVMATQNPIEQDGTYPLPEAELDRFMLKVFINYPDEEEEIDITQRISTLHPDSGYGIKDINPVIGLDEISHLQKLTRQVVVDEAVVNYIVQIVRSTRQWPGILRGAGPRASIYLTLAAKALALINGNVYATPDNVKHTAKAVLRHRILLSADKEIEGITADDVLGDLLTQVPAPRS